MLDGEGLALEPYTSHGIRGAKMRMVTKRMVGFMSSELVGKMEDTIGGMS